MSKNGSGASLVTLKDNRERKTKFNINAIDKIKSRESSMDPLKNRRNGVNIDKK